MRSVLKRGLIAAAILIAPASAHAQSFPLKWDSLAGTNSEIVLLGKVQLRSLVIGNSTANESWLKLYDVSAAPTCNSSTVLFKVPTPFTSNNSTVTVVEIPDGLQFQNGLGFCLTGGSGDTDNTNAVTGITLNFGVKP